MADLTPEKEQEFKFRLRLEQEQAQEKAAQAEAESQEGYINPLTPTIVGAAAGPVVGPSISAGTREVQRGNIARQMGVSPTDLEWDSAGQKWARKTGFGAGEGKTVQEVNEEFKRMQAEKNKPVGRGKIASKMTGPYNVEKAAELADAETARQARFAAQRQAEAAAMKKYAPLAERMNLPSGVQTAGKALGAGFSGGIPAILGRGIAGGATAYQGVDALNRLRSGDISGGLISGLGALGSAASFVPHPILRYGGMGVAGGAELLNQYLDSLKQKNQGYAEGGSAKKKMSKAERAAKAIRENNKKKVPQLADGGQVPTIGAVETLPVKFGMESPNPNPYGFTAPTGPASQALVPYYNKVTGESWTAPSGGYTPPSADWFQGSAGSSPVAPLPGFAPGADPVAPYMPIMTDSMPPRAPTGGIISEAPPSQSLLNEIRGATTPPAPVQSGLNSLVQTNAPKPVASITQQQPFQQRRVAPPLQGTMNPPIKPRALPYTPKPIPKLMPRRRMFAEGGSTTPAWQRSEGKNPEGGLNAVGRASYNRETGGNLKAPQPEGGSRKKSFCARMGGMKKKLTSSKTANDPDSRINKALRKWKC